MKYMGSKNRIAKHIVPLILEHLDDDMIFIDACCGGCNLLDKIPNTVERYGNDINPYLISMWREVSKGWMPPKDITEEDYYYMRDHKAENPALTAYCGFALSYGGKWFGGWRRDSVGKRNYVDEAYRNAQEQFPKLRGVTFANKSILDINPTKKALIYVDPPYYGTTKYNSDFNHKSFYSWCRLMRSQGNTILVSEYQMPPDFIEIWSKQITSSLTNTGSKTATEKLYLLVR